MRHPVFHKVLYLMGGTLGVPLFLCYNNESVYHIGKEEGKVKEMFQRNWQALDIRHKIIVFTGSVLLIIVLAGILDVWVVRFSVVDFYKIMEDNSRNDSLVQRMEEEAGAFEAYVKKPDEGKEQVLKETMEATRLAVEQMPLDYESQGAQLYATAWSVSNSYEVYVEKRDRILQMEEENPEYISSLYEVYDMQTYLVDYARKLMAMGLANGNRVYHEKYPWMLGIPAAIIVVTLLLFYLVIRLGKMMNTSIITPVIRLADASRKIAANDFFIEDIMVENRDEIGDLVHAFNKMKFATGRYIQTMEENRMALDKLHEKEVERLEMERRLESAKMELLTSQINPHFLFNTLNVIGGMANLEDADITEKMIKALSDLFRYTLKNDQSEVTLSRELKVINDYMYLQHMRFGVRISYEIDCRVDADAVLVPVFMLQPLVENAIIHGLSPKVEGGKIKIRIWKKRQSLYVAVADNGAGMDPDILARLRTQIACEGNEALGIGFGNVYKRVKAMYPDSRVTLVSRKNRGTVIRFEIPCEKGGE